VDAEMTAMGAEGAGQVELEQLLEAVFQRYHYDFRHYAPAHVRRRVAHTQASLGCPSIAGLLDRVLREPATFATLLEHLTIQVTDLFRDPRHFRAIREGVVPHLATYPTIRVWVAGCATGEEAYSIAIVLSEAGLLERSLIYATDIHRESLRKGERGVYALERVRGFSENYFRSGGRASLSDYYTAAYSHVAFDPALRKHILFSDHCLVTDAVFAEVQLVSCRNVLIYFGRELQDRAIGLLRQSLCPRGFLALGASETLTFSQHGTAFDCFAAEDRIYRVK
jgi:chemotaxis protein methyltransferase CheR